MADLMMAGLLSTDFSLDWPWESTRKVKVASWGRGCSRRFGGQEVIRSESQRVRGSGVNYFRSGIPEVQRQHLAWLEGGWKEHISPLLQV